MILKRMTQNAGGDYCKSLRQRSWAALAILAIGLTGLGCYLWLVPGSGLSDHAQGFYLGGACGITAGGLGLLIRNQWMLRHPEKWRKARIQETDERNQRITAQAAQIAGRWIQILQVPIVLVLLLVDLRLALVIVCFMGLYSLLYLIARSILVRRM